MTIQDICDYIKRSSDKVNTAVVADLIEQYAGQKVSDNSVTLEELTVTLNGVYTAGENKGYSKVTVNVPDKLSPEVASVASAAESELGKTAAQLMGSDVKILEDGSVIGTIMFVNDFTQFSNDPTQITGNYFWLKLGSKYSGKDVTVQRTGKTEGTAKTVADTSWILRLTDGKDTVFKITAPDVDPLTLNFAKADVKAPEKMSADVVSLPTEAEEYLGKKPNQLMGSDVEIFEDGSVTGTFPYVSDFEQFSNAPAEKVGNFCWIKLGSKYDGKNVTVQRIAKTEGTPKTVMDTTWVLRLSEGKETKFKITAPEVTPLVLSFEKAELKSAPEK